MCYVPPATETCVCRNSRPPLGLADAKPLWMLGVSGGWPPDHAAGLVSVKLLHEVSALRVAAGDVHHSLVVTIDGPNVETLLGLADAACHVPLVIRREGDGACTIHPELHSYAASATARAFRRNWRIGRAPVPLRPLHAKKMRYPPRAEQSMAHSGFDQCGASFAVFGNLILDEALHPMLQNGAAFAA